MRDLVAVGCHAYAGGFAHGVERAGFRILAELAPDMFGVESHRLNFPSAQQRVGFPEWKSQDFKGIDLLFANPPCAPWSTLGKGGGRNDLRLNCWAEVVKAYVDSEPVVFAGESIQQFYRKGIDFVRELCDVFVAHGCEVHVVLHDAKFLGLAQQRRRVFVVGSRVRLDFEPPPDPRVRTVREAIGDVADPGPLPYEMKTEWLPPYHLCHITGDSGLRTAFRACYGEPPPPGFRIPRLVTHVLEWDRPAGTIAGDVAMHPEQPRAIGLRELVRLMGFPDDWVWPRPHRCDTPLLVKGVTPNCAEYVARAVRAGIESNGPARVGEVREWTYCAASSSRRDDVMLRMVREL